MTARFRLRVLDLFSGLGGWSAPAVDAGDDVIRVEIEEWLPAEIHGDVRDLRTSDLPWRPDLILASPPCEAFSVVNIGRHWYRDGRPKTDEARHGLELVEATLRLVSELNPTYWVLENPRGKLRVLAPVASLERRTVTYCHYGEQRMKPTDLFSSAWPPSLVLAAPCRNGDPCHVRAPRGSKTGTQGYGSYWEKARMPYPLARAVIDAARADLRAGRAAGSLTLWADIA